MLYTVCAGESHVSKWLDPQRLARLRQKQENSFTPVFLHRPMAILLLIPLADVPWITPNRLTTLSVLMRFVAAYLIWPEALGGLHETPALLWTTVALWHLGGALDAADGTLARYRGTGSLFGRYYDKVSDRLITLCLVLALSARVYERTGQVHFVLLAMVYVALMSATSVAKWIDLGLQFEMNRGAETVADPGEHPAPQRTPLQWVGFLVWSLRYVFVVTEMDLPLWGSIALLTAHEDWLFYYLAGFSIPYALYTVVNRGARLARTEREFRAKQG
jgi:phosphatidylglycerophosphate synthase